MSVPPTRRLFVVVVAVTVLATPALAPAAALTAPSTTATTADVSVDPGSSSIEVGSTTTVDVVVDAPEGINSYQLNASLSNGTVADITDVTLGGSPTFPEKSYGPDNDTATAGGAGTTFDSTTPTIVTFELSGDVAGETSIDLSAITVKNESGDEYDVGTVDGGSLTVTAPDSNVTVTDLEDVGSVEQGTTASVSTTVKNTGDADTDADVSFAVDGSQTASRTVSLAVDESRTLTFDVDTGSLSAGSHSYTVSTTDDEATQSFDVTDSPDEVSVELQPTDATVATGGSTSFEVVATAGGGIQGASVSVGLTDATAAQITGASPNGDAAFPAASVGADNETADLEIGYLSDEDASDGLTVGTVTLTGEAAGETSVDVTDATLTNESSEYTIDQFGSAQLTVTDEQPQATVAVTPSNASVSAGSNTTYQVLASADGTVTATTLSVALTDNATANVTAIAPGLNATANAASVGADGGSASIDAEFDSARDASSGLVLAEIVVDGSAAGETNLSVTGATLADGSTDYDVTVDGEGRLVVTEPNPIVTGEDPATDPDGDGRYEDVDGNGQADLFDALTYYNEADSDAIQNNPELFDFDDNGEVGTLFDALALYNLISG